MIKNKEATDSAAVEFCHILNKFTAQLDECLSFKDFGLRQNSRASFRRKLGESAICSKYEQNSTASLSVAYLFFIIYSKSTVGQLTKLNFFLCINRYIPIHPISNHTDNNKQHHISSSKHFQSDHDRCDQCICCASKDCCVS